MWRENVRNPGICGSNLVLRAPVPLADIAPAVPPVVPEVPAYELVLPGVAGLLATSPRRNRTRWRLARSPPPGHSGRPLSGGAA